MPLLLFGLRPGYRTMVGNPGGDLVLPLAQIKVSLGQRYLVARRRVHGKIVARSGVLLS